jgi:YD repeat-containing protein
VFPALPDPQLSSTGESVQFERDSQGRIIKIIDPDENSIRYTYDAAGDLRSVTDQVSNTTTMDYRGDTPHFLERITGPDGNVVNQVKYDDDLRFVALVDALGHEIRHEYDLDNNTFVQTDRNGHPPRRSMTIAETSFSKPTPSATTPSTNIRIRAMSTWKRPSPTRAGIPHATRTIRAATESAGTTGWYLHAVCVRSIQQRDANRRSVRG